MGRLVLSVLGLIFLGVVSALCLAQAQEGWEVSGTVTLDSKPVKGISVFIGGLAGEPKLPNGLTDAQGNYSIKGVAPGQYRIAVQTKENMSAPEPKVVNLAAGMRVKLDFRITKLPVISGRVLDENRRPVPGVIVDALGKYTAAIDGKVRMNSGGVDKTNDLGEYRIPYLRNEGYVVAVRSERVKIRKRAPESKPSVSAPARGYPPITFYPGVPDVLSAGVLELRGGAERTGVDFVLQKVPTGCFSFKVGKGFAGDKITALITAAPGFQSPSLGDGRVAAGESYEACGLAPGEYALTVTSLAEGTKEEFPEAVELGKTIQVLGYQAVTALVDKDKNLDLGTLEPIATADAQGRVTVQDARPGDPIPSGVAVRFTALELRPQYTDWRFAKVQTDGTVTVPGRLFAGNYAVWVDAPAGYYVIGAYQQARNVVKGAFHTANGDVEIKLGTDGCTLAGRVVAEDGSAIANALVFLVPKDPASNHLAVQSDHTGAYSFPRGGIAPGSYTIVAAQDLLSWQRFDAATAARLADHGKELKLNPRESRIMDVKVQPLP